MKAIYGLDVQRLSNAKDEFFQNWGIIDDGSRKRELVMARCSFAAAFITIASVTTIARAMGRDHSVIVYYMKQHDSLIKYPDYRRLYESARDLKEHIYNGVQEDEAMTYVELKTEVQRLRTLVVELNNYKSRMLEIEKIIAS
jgi:hypothetical protein